MEHESGIGPEMGVKSFYTMRSRGLVSGRRGLFIMTGEKSAGESDIQEGGRMMAGSCEISNVSPE